MQDCMNDLKTVSSLPMSTCQHYVVFAVLPRALSEQAHNHVYKCRFL